jgi:hypothetical protein
MYLVGVFIVVGFLLGFMEKLSTTFLVRVFGKRGIMITAWIGTPIHEIGHLIQCILWRHKVTKIKLLQTNSPDDVLGYVEHQYNPKSIYQQVGNFFIGLGPIFSGIGSLILGMYLLVPQSYATFQAQIPHHLTLQKIDVNLLGSVGETVITLSKSLFTMHNLSTPSFWIFIVLAICISSHIALSKADIQNSIHGLIVIFSLLVLFNLIAGMLQVDSSQMINDLMKYNAYILAFSSIAVLFSFVTLGISFLLYKLKRT